MISITMPIPYGIIFLSDDNFEDLVPEIDESICGGNTNCIWLKTLHEVDGESTIGFVDARPTGMRLVHSGNIETPSRKVTVSLSDLTKLISELVKKHICTVEIFVDDVLHPSNVKIHIIV